MQCTNNRGGIYYDFYYETKKKAQNLFDLVLFWYKYLNYLTQGLAYLVGIWFVPFVGCLPTSLERRCCKAGGRRSLLLVEISGQAVSRLFVHCVALDLIKLGVLTNSSPAETVEKEQKGLRKGGNLGDLVSVFALSAGTAECDGKPRAVANANATHVHHRRGSPDRGDPKFPSFRKHFFFDRYNLPCTMTTTLRRPTTSANYSFQNH